MKYIITALFLGVFATTAIAEPIYVLRPTLKSNVLPQGAFETTSSAVFTSAGFSSALPLRMESGNTGIMREVPINYGYANGYSYCEIVDDAAETLSSKMEVGVYTGSPGNTPALSYKALRAGTFQLVLSCGSNSEDANPVEKFKITVT